MILPESRSIEWLQKIATENKFANITLLEKSIRAFSLLESLVLSGCPFVFKGRNCIDVAFKFFQTPVDRKQSFVFGFYLYI